MVFRSFHRFLSKGLLNPKPYKPKLYQSCGLEVQAGSLANTPNSKCCCILPGWCDGSMVSRIRARITADNLQRAYPKPTTCYTLRDLQCELLIHTLPLITEPNGCFSMICPYAVPFLPFNSGDGSDCNHAMPIDPKDSNTP